MHWRTPFPPKHPSLLAEIAAVLRRSLHPDSVLKPDEAKPHTDEAATAPETAQHSEPAA